MSRLLRHAVIAQALLLAGCLVGPDYEKPDITVPEDYSEPTTDEVALIDLQWWEVFNDPELQLLVADALESTQRLDGTSLPPLDRNHIRGDDPRYRRIDNRQQVIRKLALERRLPLAPSHEVAHSYREAHQSETQNRQSSAKANSQHSLRSEAQQQRIKDAAEEYIFGINWQNDIRFDIACVTAGSVVEVFEDAF